MLKSKIQNFGASFSQFCFKSDTKIRPFVNTEKTFTTKYLHFLINSTGVSLEWQTYLTERLILVWKYYLLYSFIMLTSSQLIILKDSETLSETCAYVTFITTGVFLNITTLIIHIKKQNMFGLLKNLGDFEKLSLPMGYAQTTDEKFKKLFLSLGLSFFAVYGIAMFLPVLLMSISELELGDPNTLMMRAWFPWRFDTRVKYILTIMLQFSWLGAVSVPILAAIPLVVYSLIEVKSQLEILSQMADNIRKKSGDGACLSLKDFIRYHQVLMRFINNFCACFNWVFTANLIYSAVTLSLILFVLKSDEIPFSCATQYFISFPLVFLYLLLYCYTGEVLGDTNEKVKTMLYEIEWYEQTMEFRKQLVVFFCILNCELKLKATPTYVASLNLVQKILDSSYSYYNFLLTISCKLQFKKN